MLSTAVEKNTRTNVLLECVRTGQHTEQADIDGNPRTASFMATLDSSKIVLRLQFRTIYLLVYEA